MAENGKLVGEKSGVKYIKPKPYAYPEDYYKGKTKENIYIE